MPMFTRYGVKSLNSSLSLSTSLTASDSNPITRSVSGGTALVKAFDDDNKSAGEVADSMARGIQALASITPETAILAQGANIFRDAYGFVSNTFDKGLTEEDTLKLYEKKIKSIQSQVYKETKEEYKDADEWEKETISHQRHEDVLERVNKVLAEMTGSERAKLSKKQHEKESGKLPNYILDVL